MTNVLVKFTDHMTKRGHMTPCQGHHPGTPQKGKIISSHPSHILPSDILIIVGSVNRIAVTERIKAPFLV